MAIRVAATLRLADRIAAGKVRSTTHRRGSTWKPPDLVAALDDLTSPLIEP